MTAAERLACYEDLFDPPEAYANQDGHWLLLGTWAGDDQAAIDPFAAVTLDLAGLWVD